MLRPPLGLYGRPSAAAYTTTSVPSAYTGISAFSRANNVLAPSTFRSLVAPTVLHTRPVPSLLKTLAAPPFMYVPYAPRGLFSSVHVPYQEPRGGAFNYGIAAAYSAKNERLQLGRNTVMYDRYPGGAFSTVTETNWDNRKALWPQSGEDSYFVADIGAQSENNGIAFGVADGVGGWGDYGVNPADFAHPLCEYMALASKEYPYSFGGEPNAPYPLRPEHLMEISYDAVLNNPRITAGGSTACVGIATSAGELEVANLGDSGYAHISPLRLNYVSEHQTHSWNAPFQLSKIPGYIQAQQALFGGPRPLIDYPVDASISRRKLQHGDFLVFATDGLWDNLWQSDILRITCEAVLGMRGWIRSATGEVVVSPEFSQKALRPEGKSWNMSAIVAGNIVAEAKEVSHTDRDGPFAKEAQRAHPKEGHTGGKIDDICVLVVAVCQE